jgi:hypothetical protein
MTSASFNSLSFHNRIHNDAPYVQAGIKALTQPGASQATSDPALVQWYEQAYAYYNAVTSGDPGTPRPSDTEWNDFLQQMQWAAGQLGYGSSAGSQWGDAPVSGPLSQNPQAPQSNAFGGTAGTMNNWAYTDQKATIGFTGDPTPNDIWSNDVNINVSQLSATVTSEITTDTRLQPPEQVLKIVVTDPATGTQSAYFVHDYSDATVKINVPNSHQVTDNSGGLVQVGRYSAQSQSANQRPQASVAGEEVDSNHWVYEGTVGQAIDFYPQADGNAEVHEVYGDANISVRTSDHVAVTQGMPGDSQGYTVVVTHRDGSTDTFQIHHGFKVNLNALPGYITWGSGTEGAETSVPDAFSQDFTLNSANPGASGGGEVGGDANFTTDGNARVWDGTSFDINTRKDGKTNNIFARGDVTLHASSSREYWTVEMVDGQYVVKVYDDASHDASHLKETFNIDPEADHLNLDIDSSHVEFLGSLGQSGDSHQLNGNDANAAKIHLATGSGSTDSTGDVAPTLTPELQALASFTGATSDNIIAAIRATFVSAPADPTAFQQWLSNTSNWLPNPPTQDTIRLIARLDPTLQTLIQSLHGKKPLDVLDTMRNLETRFAENLKRLYPSQAANIGLQTFGSGLLQFTSIHFGATNFLVSVPTRRGSDGTDYYTDDASADGLIMNSAVVATSPGS